MYFSGGSVINNGGTATIATGQNATDTSTNYSTPNNIVLIGGSGYGLNGSGNGYVNMSGGVLSGSNPPLQEVLGVNSG